MGAHEKTRTGGNHDHRRPQRPHRPRHRRRLGHWPCRSRAVRAMRRRGGHESPRGGFPRARRDRAADRRGPERRLRARHRLRAGRSRAAGELKASHGAIVNTASVAGLGVRGSSIAYGASKAGLVNLTKKLARALAPGVRVNAVAPGLVDSPWTKSWPAERKQGIVDQTLLGRMATPADIAEAMLFLAAGAAYVTGETLAVAGGLN